MDKKEYDNYVLHSTLLDESVSNDDFHRLVQDIYGQPPVYKSIAMRAILVVMVALVTFILVSCGGGGVEYFQATDPTHLSAPPTMVYERGNQNANPGK